VAVIVPGDSAEKSHAGSGTADAGIAVTKIEYKTANDTRALTTLVVVPVAIDGREEDQFRARYPGGWGVLTV